MAVRLIVLMSWVIIVMMWMPETWFDGACSFPCHSDECRHSKVLKPLVGESFYTIADSSTRAMIAALNQGWAWLNARLHNIDRRWYYAIVGSVVTMLSIGEVTAFKGALTGFGWYYYCTDWCIRIGNLTGLTYGGVCFVVFVVGIPGVLIVDFIWGLWTRNRRQQE